MSLGNFFWVMLDFIHVASVLNEIIALSSVHLIHCFEQEFWMSETSIYEQVKHRMYLNLKILLYTIGPVTEQVMLLENIGTSILVSEEQVNFKLKLKSVFCLQKFNL